MVPQKKSRHVVLDADSVSSGRANDVFVASGNETVAFQPETFGGKTETGNS